MRRTGYSLIEIIVVISIMAVAITVATPSISKTVERYQVRNLLRSVGHHLGDLRVTSFRESRSISSAEIKTLLQTELADDWVIEVSEETHFSALGYCPGGTLTMTNDSGGDYSFELEPGNCMLGDRI